jgi:hypothetical protein
LKLTRSQKEAVPRIIDALKAATAWYRDSKPDEHRASRIFFLHGEAGGFGSTIGSWFPDGPGRRLPKKPSRRPGSEAELPSFLARHKEVDLRQGTDDDEGLGRLVWGITGERRSLPPPVAAGCSSSWTVSTEVPRALPRYSQREAREAAERLVRALNGSDYGSQRLKVLIGSPLLLTLVCVVVVRGGDDLIVKLCDHFDDESWHEVLLLLAGLPGRRVFRPLMTRLLRSRALLDRADLIRACLDEAPEVELEPFLEGLGPEEEPARQAAVLRLLRGRLDRLRSVPAGCLPP